MTQPWQGEGAIIDQGHGKLEPFLLTQNRRLTHDVEYVAGLDLVPLSGFDRIPLAVPRLGTSGTAAESTQSLSP